MKSLSDAKRVLNLLKNKGIDKSSQKFEDVIKPVIKYINDNWHPHTRIIIDHSTAELLTGEMVINTEEFLRD